MIVAILVLRNGPGASKKRLEDTIELALRRFDEVLDKQLDSRFESLLKEMVNKDELRLQLKLLETTITSEVGRLDHIVEQMDERITQTSEQTQMVIKTVLKARGQ